MLKTATEQDCQEGEWSKQYIGGDTALQLTNHSKKVRKNRWLLILQQFYADSWQRGGTKCYYNKLSITVDRRQKTAKLPPVNLITYYMSQSDIWHPGDFWNLINSKGALGDSVWYQGERGQIHSRPYACAESAPLGMKPAKRAGQPQSGC
ncbi:hypothetical protein SCLCIDRAFT_8947 [Scleroderma citrinum Foug A]|uniref:Uncharacterized protein n=1 Tax=Scleroderma citrinum Foug A TaxID=1036808 RepID=A0A0C3ADG9_9AGAM|nr:hypothetical protein SCLCIDRAFT_8947 [Scleroderma citrinum Foug A]